MSSETTAVAVASSAGAFKAITADVVDLLAFQEKDYTRKRDAVVARVLARMIMDPSDPAKPLLDQVPFRPDPEARTRGFTVYDTGEGQVVEKFFSPSLRVEAMLPDRRSGELVLTNVIPAFICDGLRGVIPYIKQDDRDNWSSTGKIICMFFHNSKRGGPPVAVPLGLVRPNLIEHWNKLVTHPDRAHATRKLFTIAAIPNVLRTSTPLLVFTPIGGPWIPIWNDPRPVRKAIKDGNPLPDPDFEIATRLLGKTVVPARGSDLPAVYDLKDGEGYLECVFKVIERSTSVMIVYMGELRNMGELEDQTLEVDSVEFNPFDTLGLVRELASPGRAMLSLKDRLVRGPLDENNVLYMMGRELLVILPGQPDAVVRSQMRLLGSEAVDKASAQLEQLKQDHIGRLTMPGFPSRPSLEDILGELKPEALKRAAGQRNGDCALATWIAENVEDWDEFNWNSWLHRGVRFGILMSLANAEGLRMPKQPKQQKRKKKNKKKAKAAEPASASEASEPLAEETPRERKNRLARERRAAKKKAKEQGTQPSA